MPPGDYGRWYDEWSHTAGVALAAAEDAAAGQAYFFLRRRLYDALTCPKQYHGFTAAEGGGGHCEGMGQRLWEQVVFSWLSDVLAGG